MSDEQKPYDAGDPDAVAQKRKKAKWTQARKDAWLRDALSTPDGRRFFWEFLSDACVFQDGFHQSNAQTAFNCGMRNRGLAVLADITRAAPEAFITMMNEAKENEL